MLRHSCLFSLVIICTGLSPTAAASDCNVMPGLTINTKNIFNLSDEETIWIHKLANSLNSVTKPSTIRNELAYLSEKCEITEEDLREIERNLRKLKYIQTAKANFDTKGNIDVETTDKWTLLPTVDFGRKGGVNKYGFGVKDRNLLGYGIDTEIEYFKDIQRTGYKLDVGFPLYLGYNMHSEVTLVDTDDGSIQSLKVVKPFVSFDTELAFDFSFYQSDLSEQFFLNGDDYYSLRFEDEILHSGMGGILTKDEDTVLRYQQGLEIKKRRFYDATAILPYPQPVSRDYAFIYYGFDYLENRYEEFSNINVINQIEDFNIGWHLNVRVGLNVNQIMNDESRFAVDAIIEKGTRVFDNALLFSHLNLKTNFGVTTRERAVFEMQNELFYKLSNRFGLYGSQRITLTKNPYVDEPVSVGEESGVRGYPLDFQRGLHKAAFTGEFRYYPNVNIYNLFDLGAAAFIDTGKAFNTDEFPNDTNAWLTSVGVGARLYSRHASDVKVIHIDMSFPMLKHDNVNNVEFLITTRTSF